MVKIIITNNSNVQKFGETNVCKSVSNILSYIILVCLHFSHKIDKIMPLTMNSTKEGIVNFHNKVENKQKSYF